VRALYDLRLLDRTTKPVSRWPNLGQIEPSLFDTRDSNSAEGYTKFEKKSEIEKYLVDDALIMECNISIINLMLSRLSERSKSHHLTSSIISVSFWRLQRDQTYLSRSNGRFSQLIRPYSQCGRPSSGRISTAR
jgi:hypothetical protein